jgi:hypothetical protein
MTPAYPVLKPSHVSGIVKAEMSLFNSREDVSYYQIEVFDLNWNNLPFSTTYKIMRVDYKERRDFDVYIRKSDLDIATYICSTSKVKRKSGAQTLISSRICSKINGDAA